MANERMTGFNAIVWDQQTASKKAKEFVDHYKRHVELNTKRWRENEATFRSDFYKQWSKSTLKISDVLNGVEERFKDWIVKAHVNHIFTFVRLLHSMLMSNESIVTASPATADASSKEAASAADRLIRYSRRKYEVREFVDLFVLHALIYGLGLFKISWNPLLGDLINNDEKESWKNLIFTGDIESRIVSPYDYCLFATGNHLKKVYGYMEKMHFDKDELEAMYPKFKGKFQEEKDLHIYDGINNVEEKLSNKVTCYEYWEMARPFNANMGRYMLFLEDGTILELKDNPMKDRSLPIAMFADVILPNSLYPISVVDLLREPQSHLNDLMSRVLENVKLYARIFLLVDRNANLNKDALEDNPVIPMEYNGSEGRPPEPMKVPSLPAFIFKSYDMLVEIMQHIAGIRDFSRGVMPQRVSGFAANLMVPYDMLKKFAHQSATVLSTIFTVPIPVINYQLRELKR